MTETLSQYEQLRLDRIARNNARLASLGLLDKPIRKSIVTPKKQSKKRTHNKVVTPSPQRASRRVKRKVELFQPSFDDFDTAPSTKEEYVGDRIAKYFDRELHLGTITSKDSESGLWTCVYDDADREEFTKEEVMEAVILYEREGKKLEAKKEKSATPKTNKAASKFRCEIPLDLMSSPLSAGEKEIITNKLQGDFLSKFEYFLTDVDPISEQNRRNVLRQIAKLASGQGIRYESKAYGWPEGCYFMKGTKIGPLDDILKLMDVGQQCEEEWGRDHGNGWLLSHPLKKLYMFQQWCLK
jgi:hypothetical protein